MKVKEIRIAMGLSREKFAHEVGVTGQTIYRWETGQAAPHAEFAQKLEKLAKKLKGAE